MATRISQREEAFRAFDTTPDEEVAAAEALVRRFLFSYDFDAPREEPKIPDAVIDGQVEEVELTPPPPPPLFTEEDLEAVREEARVLGHAEGLKDAEDSAMHFQVQALESIAEQIGSLRARQDEANREAHRAAALLAVAAVKKLLPRFAAAHGVEEIEALVAECVPHILNEPRLILRVATQHAEAIQGRIEALARDRGFEGTVVVMADDTLGLADCRLEWDDGGAERDVETLFQRIQDIVARNSERPPDALNDEPALPGFGD